MTFVEVNKSIPGLPPDLLNLPMIEAELYVQVSSDPELRIEGPAFDRDGNLFVSSPYHGRIYRISEDKRVSKILDKPGIKNIGCAIHKNGRLFYACGTGELFHVKQDGSDMQFITPRIEGRPARLNDLVFDKEGNLYVTDFAGTVPNPTGGVYRFSNDFSRVDQILGGLAGANGVSLSPEGDALWIGETFRNAILRIGLANDGVKLAAIDPVCYAYYNSGVPGGPDSNKVDEEGNLYQCVVSHGRAIVLNKCGIPIANILIPGRDQGYNLKSTNLAFKPGTNEGYITAGGLGGPSVFRFYGLAKGLSLYSHT